MKTTSLTLLEQLRITDRDIKRRKELLHFSDKDRENLVHSKSVITENIDNIVTEFYNDQTAIVEISRLIGDAETLARLKKYMRKYILDLFEGDYSSEYVQSRLRIGMVHKRIGVTPKLYISAVHKLQGLLTKYIKGNSKENCADCIPRVDALEKIILFDLELVFDTYIHTLMNEINRSKEDIENYAESLEEAIAERTEELQLMARTDALTGLLNQKTFFEELRRELSRSQRQGEALSLAYIDVDNFKRINDTFGHKRGDEVIQKVASCIKNAIRETDIPARYGGDEFCVIFPFTNIHGAQTVCNHIVKVFNENIKTHEVTLSIGISESDLDNIYDADMLIKLADQAMYRSKEKEGNMITWYIAS